MNSREPGNETEPSLHARLAAAERRVAELEAELTGHRQSKEQVAREQNLLQVVIDNVPGYIYAKDRLSRFLLANQETVLLLGAKTMAEVVGKSDYDFFPTEMAAQFYQDEQRLMDSGVPLLNHEEMVTDPSTGRVRWNMSTKVPLRDQDGQIIGLVGLNWDVTARREADAAAHRSALRDEIIRAQAALLDALSTPLLAISDRALLMPLIGAVNPERARRIVQVLSEGVVQHRAAYVILDLTGAQLIEAEGTRFLVEGARIVRLLGAELLISGMSPAMARSQVELLGDVRGIRTYGSLRSAVAATLR